MVSFEVLCFINKRNKKKKKKLTDMRFEHVDLAFQSG